MRAAVLISVLLLWVNAVPRPPSLGKRCDKARLRVNCGSHAGIFWKLGIAPFAGVTTVAGYRPLDIVAGTRAIVAVCNLANTSSRRQTSITLPSLIRHIGADAVVTVQVINSVNQNVSNSFLLRSSPLRKNIAGLLGPVVKGTIGHGASLSVFVHNSANVYLERGAALYVRDAALVSSLVAPVGCVKDACVDIQLSMTGNVIGGREVLLSTASLIKGVFEAQCTEKAVVFADVRNAGIVRDTEKLVLGTQAALSRQLVDIVEAKDTNVSMGVADAASAMVKRVLDIRASYLIDAIIRVEEARGMRLAVRMENVANGVSNRRIIASGGGAQLAKVVKLDIMHDVVTMVYVHRSAGAMATSVVGLQTLRSVVAVNGEAHNSIVNASIMECGTVISDSIVIPESTSLFGLVLDVALAVATKLNVNMFDSVNTRTAQSAVSGALVSGLVRVRASKGAVSLNVKGHRSANMHCYRGHGNASITGTMVKSGVSIGGRNANVKIDLDRFANIFLHADHEVELMKRLIEGENAIRWLRLREAYVGLRLGCDSKDLNR